MVQISLDIDEAPIAVLAPEIRVFNLGKLFLGVCRLQEPRLLISLDVHVVAMAVAEVAVVVAVAEENLLAHAQDAFVVRISARVLYELLKTRKGDFVVGAIRVVLIGLVLHAIDQGIEDLEAGRASVVLAHEMFIALCRRRVVDVAADATVEVAWNLVTRTVDL